MKKWKLAISSLAIAAALAGCSSNTEEAANTAATNTTNNSNGQAAGTQQAPQGGMMMGGTMGKIKSIDGQTITIYTSSFTPGNGGGGGQPPADGEKPAQGEQGEPPTMEEGQAPEGGGRMNMENMFSDETMEITVTDTTKIVSTTFENEKMVETDKTLADLKADDIITITLKEGTQEAESIRIGGGFGGGGGGRPGGNGQQGDSAAAAS